MIGRIAYAILKTIEVTIFMTCVCLSVYFVAVLIALLAEIHPAFWLVGIILSALSVYFFFSYDGEGL